MGLMEREVMEERMGYLYLLRVNRMVMEERWHL
jgi:hypothetical protein